MKGFMNMDEQSSRQYIENAFEISLMHRGGKHGNKHGDKHGDRSHVEKKENHNYSKYEDAYYNNDYVPPNVWSKFNKIMKIV